MKYLLGALILAPTLALAASPQFEDCANLLVGRSAKFSTMSGWQQNNVMEPKTNKIVTATVGMIRVFDPATGRAKTVFEDSQNYSTLSAISPDKRWVFLASRATPAHPSMLYDVWNDRITEVPMTSGTQPFSNPWNLAGSVFSADSKKLVVSVSSQQLMVYDIEAQALTPIDLPSDITKIISLAKSNSLFILLKDRPPLVLSLTNFAISDELANTMDHAGVPWKAANLTIDLSSDEKTWLFKVPRPTDGGGGRFHTDSDYLIYETDSATLKKIDIDPKSNAVALSPGGGFLSVGAAADAAEDGHVTFRGDSYLLDHRNGQKLALKKSGWMFDGKKAFSEDGTRYLNTDFSSSEVQLIELKDGFPTKKITFEEKTWIRPVRFAPDQKSVFFSAAQGGGYTISTQLIRWYFDTDQKETYQLPGFPNIEVLEDGQSVLYQENNAAKTYLSLTRWRDLPKSGPIRLVPPSREEKLALYRKIFDPVQFRMESDLPVLYDYFVSGFYKDDPSWILPALWTVLDQSDILYDYLVASFPDLLSKAWPMKVDLSKYSREVLIRWNRAALFYAKRKFSIETGAPNQMLPYTQVQNWVGIFPLRPFLRSFGEKQTGANIDLIANSLAYSAGIGPYNGIYNAKLYKFDKHFMNRIFGREARKLTDFTIARDGQKIKPFILALEPINEDPKTRTDFGFFAQALPEITVPDNTPPNTSILTRDFSWSLSGRAYHARLSITSGDKSVSDIIPRSLGPNYEDIWKDGSLTGLVVAGSNMHGDIQPLLATYRKYYEEQGFTFTAAEETADSKQYLLDKISGGELDYLIKEAHVDGDDQNLFRTYAKSAVLKGVRALPEGKQEVVYILFPHEDEKDAPTQLIPNLEFGEAVKKREAAGYGQMIYFNTSCNGISKVINEIESASSGKLVVIGSKSLADTFDDNASNAEYIMFTGIRQGLTYAQIREALKADRDYVANTWDVFLFPDQPEYDELIRQRFKLPLKVEIAITGPDGQPYNIDNVPEIFSDQDPWIGL